MALTKAELWELIEEYVLCCGEYYGGQINYEKIEAQYRQVEADAKKRLEEAIDRLFEK